MSPLHRHTSVRAWLISLAVTTLLLVQSIGTVHGIVHVPRGPAGAAVSQSLALSAPTGFLKELSALFAGHDRDGDCQLYDQLSHADLASIPSACLPTLVLADVLAVADPALPLVAHTLASRARGPPQLA